MIASYLRNAFRNLAVFQVPLKLPPGMPADQAQGILTYLKTNPEAAKAAWAQAQAIMQSPGLANQFINMSVSDSSSSSCCHSST